MQLLASGYTRDTTFLDYYFDSAYDHLGGGILGGSVVKILGMGFGQIGCVGDYCDRHRDFRDRDDAEADFRADP